METGLRVDALVVGSGPAGLMAADVISAAGHTVLIADAKPSLGRKLLMAGKSGLNLTKDEDPSKFLSTYWDGQALLEPHLAGFGPEQVRVWAEALGQETFRGTSGRIFPKSMKASPILRALLRRLEAQGVTWRTRWRWTGRSANGHGFETPDGFQTVEAGATVLALGGGSWARLGSDGTWSHILSGEGVKIAPFRPSNVGFRVEWSEHMARHFGAAVKPVRLSAGEVETQAEFVITARGVEGGGIYGLSNLLRDGAPLLLDLVPDRDGPDILARLSRPRGKASLSSHLRRSLGLSPVKIALLRECAGHRLEDWPLTAASLKALPIPLGEAFDIDEAISTGGGVAASAMDDGLMLHAWPGTFCAGEMLDWDAPTGGYLMTASLATGRTAGVSAISWLDQTKSVG